jgi:hypothetical protein
MGLRKPKRSKRWNCKYASTFGKLESARLDSAGQNAKGGDRLFSAKATGRHEYIAESVWDLERDTAQLPDENHRTRAELSVLKNRHGAAGVCIDLEFEGRLQRFTEDS